MSAKKAKDGRFGKYLAYPTKAAALRESRQVALDLPGNWRGSATNLSYPHESPEWLPTCVHVRSGATLCRSRREWFCNPGHLSMRTEFSLTPIAAVRKMLRKFRPALRAEREVIEAKLETFRKEEAAVLALSKIIGKR